MKIEQFINTCKDRIVYNNNIIIEVQDMVGTDYMRNKDQIQAARNDIKLLEYAIELAQFKQSMVG